MSGNRTCSNFSLPQYGIWGKWALLHQRDFPSAAHLGMYNCSAGLEVITCLVPTPTSLPTLILKTTVWGLPSRLIFYTPSPYHVRCRGELIDDRLCAQLHHTEQTWKRFSISFTESEFNSSFADKKAVTTGFPFNRCSILQNQPCMRGGCWQDTLKRQPPEHFHGWKMIC